jgi:glutathione S-transferase
LGEALWLTIKARPSFHASTEGDLTMQLLANATSPYARIARVALMEKGLTVEPTMVDPWADDPRLRSVNVAGRIPALVTDSGLPLTESLLIVMWLEKTRPQGASLLGTPQTTEGVLSRAGLAMGVIEAAVATMITRKVTAPTLFDDTPIGLRRRRTMAEGLSKMETQADAMGQHATPLLDDITAVVALDYLRLRFPDVTWLAPCPKLDALSLRLRARTSFATTMPG